MLTTMIPNIALGCVCAHLCMFSCAGNALAQTDSDKPVAQESGEQAQQEDSNSENESEIDVEDEENGQSDLDKAFALKLTVSSTRDLDTIADLCESAIEQGLDEESEKQATELWSSVLLEHARQLNRRIAPNGALSTRWRWLRSQAVSRLDKAIELKPDKIDALILLAKLHSLNNGDREAAIAAIEKAIEQISDNNQKLSEALYIRSRLAEDERTKFADLTQAVKINPENSEALMQRALYYLGKKESENALADFKKLLALEDNSIDRHVLISQALRERGMFQEAASVLDMALGIEAENDDLYVLRGQAFLAAEDSEKALQDLNKAIEINRQNTDALNLRARLYLIEEKYEESLNDANELMQQKPEDIQGLYLRSLIYRSQRKLAEAITDMESLLEKSPDNLDFKLDLAILLSANDKPSKAIPLFDEIIDVTPEDAHSQIYRNRGDAFLSLGEHQKAVDDYETALDLLEQYKGSQMDAMSDEREEDTRVGVLNNLAWVLATSPEESVRDGKRSIELATEASESTDYKAAYILSTLAAGFAESGDFATARKWGEKAVELAESDEQREGLQEELEFFKKDKPWRESENVESKTENQNVEPAADSKATQDDDSKLDDDDDKKDNSQDSDSENDSGSVKTSSNFSLAT